MNGDRQGLATYPVRSEEQFGGCMNCMSDALSAQTIHFSGHNGDDIGAYLARPSAPVEMTI